MIEDSLVELLRDVLPASTVYYSVLSQLHVSLVELGDGDVVAPCDSRTIVREDVKYMTGNAMGTGIARHAMLSHPAVTVRSTSIFVLFVPSLTGIPGDSPLSAKDRSFLRALLNHNYAARQEEIALEHLHLMRHNPTEVPYNTFDYTDSICAIDVRLPEGLDSEFAPDAPRATASAGKLQLHLIETLKGENIRVWAFPLYSASAELSQGLRSIAASILPNASSEEEEEQDVLEQYRAKLCGIKLEFSIFSDREPGGYSFVLVCWPETDYSHSADLARGFKNRLSWL
ncbi:hypothetical protein B0H19DRAFT_1077033 [Mycena capillaripes]|nr:hypothetical protein B0H19DRAFT_1077033 [Mycena capillaripes]